MTDSSDHSITGHQLRPYHRFLVALLGVIPATVIVPFAYLGFLMGLDGVINDYSPVPGGIGFLNRTSGLISMAMAGGGIIGTMSLWLSVFLKPSRWLGYGLIVGILSAIPISGSPLIWGPLIIGLWLCSLCFARQENETDE